MPNLPHPYELRDWRQVALDYDQLVFDVHAKGDFLPFIWWDESQTNSVGFCLVVRVYGEVCWVVMGREEALNC